MAEHHHDNHHHHTHFGLVFLLILGFAGLEALGGWWTNSLALLSDAGHMLTDAIALGLAWWADKAAQNQQVARLKSGISVPEFKASVLNAALMLGVIAFIVFEAIERLNSPPNVASGTVVWIALAGLIVNLIAARQLHHQAHHHGENLNNQAAYLHVLGDLVGSIAAIIAGVVIYLTGWQTIDPLLSLLSAALLSGMTLSLIKRIANSLQ